MPIGVRRRRRRRERGGVRVPVLDRAPDQLPTDVVWVTKRRDEGGQVDLAAVFGSHAEAELTLLQIRGNATRTRGRRRSPSARRRVRLSRPARHLRARCTTGATLPPSLRTRSSARSAPYDATTRERPRGADIPHRRHDPRATGRGRCVHPEPRDTRQHGVRDARNALHGHLAAKAPMRGRKLRRSEPLPSSTADFRGGAIEESSLITRG